MTVYFFRRLDTGAIKIGYVQVELDQDAGPALERRRLQAGWKVAAELELLTTTAGKRRVELWFHKRHAAGSLGKEWFGPTKGLLADIACLAAGETIDGQPAAPQPPEHRSRYRCWIVPPNTFAAYADWRVR